MLSLPWIAVQERSPGGGGRHQVVSNLVPIRYMQCFLVFVSQTMYVSFLDTEIEHHHNIL